MKLLTSKNFYRSVLEGLLDGLAYCELVYDVTGKPSDFVYIEVNKNFEELTGLKNVEGKKATEVTPGIFESNPELSETVTRVALTMKPERLETYFASPGRWFSISTYSPKKGYFVALFQNITAQKSVEKDLEDARTAARNVLEDLQSEKNRLSTAKAKDEALLASIGDGMIATDEEGKVITINDAAARMIGYNKEEVLGKKYFEVLRNKDTKGNPVPTENRPISIALTTGKKVITNTTTPPYYYVRKDGTEFPVALTATPIIFENQIVGVIDTFRDITKESEIDKAKTEFVSLASHQLRTPLSTVSWYSEMLLTGDAGKISGKQKEYLDEIYRGNRRMVNLVNSLLNVSRLELGTFTAEPEAVDVLTLMHSVIIEQKQQIGEKKLNIVTSFEKTIPSIQSDPKLLRMVFQNILSNAVKYTPSGGKIEISLSLDGKKNILLTVADTGIGIPKGQQENIFTKLFRADNARVQDTEGTGLGLYIVKSILDHAKGKIWFKSVEGKGTTFYVTIPLAGMERKEGTKTLD